MKCLRCLVNRQHDLQTKQAEPWVIKPAEYVYKGTSLCLDHVNIERGFPPNYQQG